MSDQRHMVEARAIIAPFVETDGEGDVDSEGLMTAIVQALAQAERRAAEAQREALIASEASRARLVAHVLAEDACLVACVAEAQSGGDDVALAVYEDALAARHATRAALTPADLTLPQEPEHG